LGRIAGPATDAFNGISAIDATPWCVNTATELTSVPVPAVVGTATSGTASVIGRLLGFEPA